MSRFVLCLFTLSLLLASGVAHAGPKEDAKLLLPDQLYLAARS